MTFRKWLAARAARLPALATRVHTGLYRATKGRIGGRDGNGRTVLLLDHTGARTGTRRTTPLMYFTDRHEMVVVASKRGHPKHPGWYHNLLAHPATTVQVGDVVHRVSAEPTEGADRARLWDRAVESYPPFVQFRERSDRDFPIVRLRIEP